MMKWVILALTAVCCCETVAGALLVLKYARAGAYAAMAVQLVGCLVSLVGTAYGAWWLLENWRDWHVK